MYVHPIHPLPLVNLTQFGSCSYIVAFNRKFLLTYFILQFISNEKEMWSLVLRLVPYDTFSIISSLLEDSTISASGRLLYKLC